MQKSTSTISSKLAINKFYSFYIKRLFPAVGILPVALPASVAAFSVVAMFLLVISRLDNWLVWPLGLLAAVAAFVLVARTFKVKRPGSISEQATCDLLVLGGAAAWTFINAHYAAQDIFTTRDPAIYTNAGTWLIHHTSLHIPVTHIFNGLPIPYHVIGQGFGHEVGNPLYLYAQGLHLLPVWFGLTGRVWGETFAFGINSLFGALALLAVYGFARQLGRPRFAMLITGILALALPLIYFSRDTYTEPLAMLFTFSTLALLWGAQRTKSYALWGLAGLTAGAGVMTRTDAYLTLAALSLFVAALLAFMTKGRRAAVKRVLIFIACALPPTIIGWFDLTHLSSGYYRDLRHQVVQEILFVCLMVIFSAAFVAVAWKTDVLKRIDELTAAWRVPVIMTAAILILLGMASRPLWYVGHEVHVPLIGGLQAASGMPVDDTRSYAEQTVNWIGWYIGPILTVLGGFGLLLALWRFVRKKDTLLLPSLLVVGITSLVFLNLPNISPDQIWASRRLLPVILPGVAAFSVIAMEWLDKRFSFKYKQAVWVILVELMVLTPLFISYPFLRVKSYTPQLSQIESICSSLPHDAALIWIGNMKLVAVQPSDIFCNVPTVGIDGANKDQLKKVVQLVQSRGKTPVIGLTAPEKPTYFPEGSFTTVNTSTFDVMAEALYHPPRHITASVRTVIIGQVQPDGMIVPLRQDK